MAAWRSARFGDQRVGWRTWLLASVVVWAAPFVLGLGLVGLAYLVSRIFGLSHGEGALHPLAPVFVVGFILMSSVIISWLGLILALLPAWGLLHKGRGGWASFALLGAGTGSVVGLLVHGFMPLALTAVHGVFAALVFRWIFSWIDPGIFTAR